MHPSLIAAQTFTLREWADIWEQDALMGSPEGYDEVVVCLRKAKYAMDKVMDPKAVEDLGIQAYAKPQPILDVKEG